MHHGVATGGIWSDRVRTMKCVEHLGAKHSHLKGIKLWFSPKGIMTIGNCSRVTYDGPYAVASHFEHIPLNPHSTHILFPPKNYIFSYFKKESSSDSAQKVS